MTLPAVPARRAFTLMEVMIVIVIIVILGAITLPRLASTENRAFELAVEQVGDLMMMYAQRDATSGEVLGLEHNRDTNTLSLLILWRDPSRASDAAEWIDDPVVKPVRLGTIIPAESLLIRADDESIDTTTWPLTHDVGEDRPAIEITLVGPQRAVTLVLPPHALAPRRLVAEGDLIAARTRVDLDAAGRDREDW